MNKLILNNKIDKIINYEFQSLKLSTAEKIKKKVKKAYNLGRIEHKQEITLIINNMIENILTNKEELNIFGEKRLCCMMTLKELKSKLGLQEKR